MRLRKTIGLSLVLLVASAPAIAKQTAVAQHPAPDDEAKPGKGDTSTVRTAARRRAAPAKTAKASAHTVPQTAEPRKVAAVPVKSAEHDEKLRVSARPRHADSRAESTRLPLPDQYIGPVMEAGAREVGRAAWYGGWHVGQRTASGERLDAIHATAAHRSLPLYSLVKVTNLNNGRSVIATINDRGPVSHSLLIDLSPRAAAALEMMHSGVARVSVVPVAPAPAPAKAH